MRHRKITLSALTTTSVAASVFVASAAFGHALLIDPPPRTNDDAIKSSPPCGAVPRTQTYKTYKEGDQLTVTWKETIDHSGCWVVSLVEENDTKVTILEKLVDDAGTLIPDRDSGAPYSLSVKLPAGKTCERCAIQLRQVMSGTATCDETTFNASTYLSCADVRITYADGGVPPVFVGPGDAGTTTGGGGDAGTDPPVDDGTDDTSTPSGTTADGGRTTTKKDGGSSSGARPNLPPGDSTGCSVYGGDTDVGFGAVLAVGVGLLFASRRKKR